MRFWDLSPGGRRLQRLAPSLQAELSLWSWSRIFPPSPDYYRGDSLMLFCVETHSLLSKIVIPRREFTVSLFLLLVTGSLVRGFR